MIRVLSHIYIGKSVIINLDTGGKEFPFRQEVLTDLSV